MRIVELRIGRWRNFEDLAIQVPRDSALVCLVGENGTGKSNILELLSAAAARMGVSVGIDKPRGDPFAEAHSGLRVVLSVSDEPREYPPATAFGDLAESRTAWDGTLVLESGTGDQTVSAGGWDEVGPAQQVARSIAGYLQNEADTHHLHLDANRAYPPTQLSLQEFAEAWTRDWDTPQWRKHWAYRESRVLLSEWFRYVIGRQLRELLDFRAAAKRATAGGLPPPRLEDSFDEYQEMLQRVLPHLSFSGADTDNGTLLFDSAGIELNFNQLSGGEREIAFLIGQIERFRLRRGLLLIDEPELHLNPDLLRVWIAFLRDSITDGQVWVGTHSLEAVEATAPESTFVLERDPDDRVARRAPALANRPVLQTLSAAVGSPAFSVARLRFVLVEGERASRERERFHDLCENSPRNRFIEAGGSRDVVSRLQAMRDLAAEADEALHVGGVIDRDFKTDEEVAQLASGGVHVLECHEVENLFLHPASLTELAVRSGRDAAVAAARILEVSDQHAGSWVLRRAAWRTVLQDNPAGQSMTVDRGVRIRAGQTTWAELASDRQTEVDAIASLQPGLSEGDRVRFQTALSEAVGAFETARERDDLWRWCFGKEVLNAMPSSIGMSDATAIVRQVLFLWRGGREAPEQVERLRRYVDSLAP